MQKETLNNLVLTLLPFPPTDSTQAREIWGGPKYERKSLSHFPLSFSRTQGPIAPQRFFTTHSKRIELYLHKPGATQPPHQVFSHQSFRVPKDGGGGDTDNSNFCQTQAFSCHTGVDSAHPCITPLRLRSNRSAVSCSLHSPSTLSPDSSNRQGF